MINTKKLDRQILDRQIKVITNLVNTHCDRDDKLALLVDCLRKVTFADSRPGHYEEQFITSVAGHIDLSDGKVAASKNFMAP